MHLELDMVNLDYFWRWHEGHLLDFRVSSLASCGLLWWLRTHFGWQIYRVIDNRIVVLSTLLTPSSSVILDSACHFLTNYFVEFSLK